MDKRTIRIAAVAAALVVLVVIVILSINTCNSEACKKEGGATVSYTDPTSVVFGDGETASASDGNQSEEQLSDNTLPERMINYFECVNVYQRAAASELDSELALAYEKNTGVNLGPAFFGCSRFSLEHCSYEVDQMAEWSDMQALGINTELLEGEYGSDAPICSAKVTSANGEYKTTVFCLGETTLIAFGEGMHVFEYRLVEAVG